MGQSWSNKLKKTLTNHYHSEAEALFLKYGDGFSVGYQAFSSQAALHDIVMLERLFTQDEMQVHTACNQTQERYADNVGMIFKVYQKGGVLPLCDVVILENMGMRTLSERPYIVRLNAGKRVWINEFYMVFNKGSVASEFLENQDQFNTAFCRVEKDIENDRLNQLIVQAGFTWKEVNLLRAYSRYMKQLRHTYSQYYIAETLIKNHTIARLLVDFDAKFNDQVHQDKAVESSPRCCMKH